MMRDPWERWLNAALEELERSKLLRSLRPVSLQGLNCGADEDVSVFDGPGQWDRDAVEVEVSANTFSRWIEDIPSTGEEVLPVDLGGNDSFEKPHKLILFSGNDYLGLSSHPAVRNAAAKAALEFGMGPRGSPLICGYTYHHRRLESSLAALKKTEECLLCPTGFSANMSVISAASTIGNFGDDKISIFSDSLNHASIIDGIRVAQRQGNVHIHVYQHNDMEHLEKLLLACQVERKMVFTDSLFSMDGDFAHLIELAALKKRYAFLLVIDDAHGTLVCGENGGGVAEAVNREDDIDIYVGTLSKAFGCHGGFIATSRKWKQLIQSRGRSFIFSTAIPVPVAAAAHAALVVAREEKWRQRAVWERVQLFSQLTHFSFSSPILPIVIGDPSHTLLASRRLLQAGFHVTAIRPPTVPPNSSRLRITVCASHSEDDVRALARALAPWIGPRSTVPDPPRGHPSKL